MSDEMEFYDLPKVDPLFVLRKIEHGHWVIAFRSDLSVVPDTGPFANQFSAQAYAMERRKEILDMLFEKEVLT